MHHAPFLQRTVASAAMSMLPNGIVQAAKLTRSAAIVISLLVVGILPSAAFANDIGRTCVTSAVNANFAKTYTSSPRPVTTVMVTQDSTNPSWAIIQMRQMALNTVHAVNVRVWKNVTNSPSAVPNNVLTLTEVRGLCIQGLQLASYY